MRAAVSVRRSRNALVPGPRARSRPPRLTSSSAADFSTSPRAIWASASFFVLVGQRARARAAARAARTRVSTSVRASIAIPLEDHQIVTMDHFVKALVPQPLLDLLRLRPPDLPELGGVEVDAHAWRTH